MLRRQIRHVFVFCGETFTGTHTQFDILPSPHKIIISRTLKNYKTKFESATENLLCKIKSSEMFSMLSKRLAEFGGRDMRVFNLQGNIPFNIEFIHKFLSRSYFPKVLFVCNFIFWKKSDATTFSRL